MQKKWFVCLAGGDSTERREKKEKARASARIVRNPIASNSRLTEKAEKNKRPHWEKTTFVNARNTFTKKERHSEGKRIGFEEKCYFLRAATIRRRSQELKEIL